MNQEIQSHKGVEIVLAKYAGKKNIRGDNQTPTEA